MSSMAERSVLTSDSRGTTPVSPVPHPFLLRHGLALLVLCSLAVVFSVMVVRDMRNPLLGRADVEQWLYQADYFAKHLSFTPLPSVDFHNDDVFYPYGVSNVFRPWHFESSYVYAAFKAAFGHGPWLQWYFVSSTLLVAVLIYLIVRREMHTRWALLVAVALSYGNFFAAGRYPLHLTYAAVHWMTLSILLDLVLVRRFVYQQPITLPLLLAKILFQALCFGQDLAYLAGTTINSSLLAGLWIGVMACGRCGTSRAQWHALIRRLAGDLGSSAKRSPVLSGLLAAGILLATYLYFPLTLQLVHEVHANVGQQTRGEKTFPIQGYYWYIFRPVLPGFVSEASGTWVAQIFRFRPGIFFGGAAVIGVLAGARSRRYWQAAVPCAAMLLVIFAMDQQWLQWLRALPWWEHSRAPLKLSAALPVLLLGLLLQLPRPAWHSRLGGWALCLGTVVLLAEGATAYGLLYRYSDRYPSETFALDQNAYDFFDVVARSDGEALMEWPFTVRGANEVCNDAMGAYGFELKHHMLYQAFHNKKVMGSYFGRLYPKQIQAFLDAGWQWLFLPNSDRGAGAKQFRDFTEEEWKFVEQFYRSNDFCGIVIYPKFLPKKTVEQFHARFGRPTAIASVPWSGEMQFIPKPAAWRVEVDAEQGRKLVFRPPALDLRHGAQLPFARNANRKYLQSGWKTTPQKELRTQSYEAKLAFAVERPSDGLFELELDLQSESGAPFALILNDKRIGVIQEPGTGRSKHRLLIRGDQLSEANSLRLRSLRRRVPLDLRLDSLRFERADVARELTTGSGEQYR